MSPFWRQVLGGRELSGRTVSRLPVGAWALVAGALVRQAKAEGRTALVLVRHPDRFLAELRPWLAGTPPTYLFAELATSPLDRPPAVDPAVSSRLEALAALATGEPAAVVSSRRAALRPTVSPELLEATTAELVKGGQTSLEDLTARLVELGYSREALVEEPGQFSVRGGILDVFPAAGRAPVRAELFGNEVDSLRIFDPTNQRSVMPVPRVTIRPGRELVLGPARGAAAAARLRNGAGLSGLRADVLGDWEDELARLATGSTFAGVEFFAAYVDPTLASLFDHLPKDALVIDFEPGRQLSEVREMEKEFLALADAEAADGELPRRFNLAMVPSDRLTARAWQRVSISSGEDEGGIDLGWSQPEVLVRRPTALADIARQGAVVIATEQTARLSALLMESGIEAAAELDLDLDSEVAAGLHHCEADLPTGVANAELGFTLLTDHELFGRVRRPVVRRGGPGRGMPTVTLEFQPGELVVHVDHGVARFHGMRIKELDGTEREYLELEYAEGDRLFVPVEFLDRIQKFLGGGESDPALNRLGTGAWEKARGRAKKLVEDIADDLLKLYAAREAKPGFAFEPDTPWQAELEASFPYEETPDQLAAMAEIKADMEAEKPMDRLLCGDVGFGKTELALRAAFKAVQSGKQVAMLVPTTILTQQHFLVFKDRLKAYPVEVAMLSRFASEAEEAAALAGIKAGTVDIVIGTHRVLQRDVRFKRLGLVIIDEEQRFGVVQKERLKRMRANVDVLTLSATPIPRTLHMAVAGIRDMSVIQTPPEDRQPIKTYVTSDEDELVRQVVERELDRGGQVYFLHNRVRTIQRAAQRIRDLVPAARVTVGHGQLDEDDLAGVMVDFNQNRYDVLVCTTIIESGLDIPNVNTILVQNADRFGLSQLYQLRGRVGRAGKRAYCYLLFDPTRSLTEDADKRLEVMSGLHELGMGFKIALRDLEIRGAGNLLGSEQHGAIAAVGFEMYVQMLGHAVQRLRSGGDEDLIRDALTTPEMNLNLPLDHFIPRSFIRDERLRLQAYRELAAAEDERQLDGLLRSLRDRYGSAPPQLDNLAFSLRVKLRGQRMGLRSVVAEGTDLVLTVDPQQPLDVDELVARLGGRLRVAPNRLKLNRRGEDWQRELIDLLTTMEELYQGARISAGV